VAMMAEAYGKLTGRPGIAFVTRGPGATNASAGVHIAHQDSTPMILLIGQIDRAAQEREAFQEVDYRRMYGPLAKWVAQIDDAARLPEFIHRAFCTAMSGRPGPVVLALPEDMLTDEVEVADGRPAEAHQAWPDPSAVARLRAMLETAERPFVILGGGGWTAEAVADMERFAEANHLPVGVSFRRQDYIDNNHACYAGDVGIGINPKLAERVKASDLLIVIGARLGEITTSGYSLIGLPRPNQPLVHVHPDPEELGRVYQADLAINAGMPGIARALAELAPIETPRWAGETRAARDAYLAHTAPVATPGDLQMGEVMAHLSEVLPRDAIMTNGAGNYAVWLNRFYRYPMFRSQLAPTSGSMGYGLPAAVAAKLVHRDRPVICFAGDGCFQMTGQELATAAQHDLAVITLVINNNMYGTIRMHQERSYPSRVYGTEIKNPDYVKLGEAHGAFAARVTRTEEFADAFAEALKQERRPSLIELVIDPEALTPRASLSEIRAQGMAAKAAAEGRPRGG